MVWLFLLLIIIFSIGLFLGLSIQPNANFTLTQTNEIKTENLLSNPYQANPHALDEQTEELTIITTD